MCVTRSKLQMNDVIDLVFLQNERNSELHFVELFDKSRLLMPAREIDQMSFQILVSSSSVQT